MQPRLRGAYSEMLLIMRTLYQTCRLVHGDLSEYNILVHEVCYVLGSLLLAGMTAMKWPYIMSNCGHLAKTCCLLCDAAV